MSQPSAMKERERGEFQVSESADHALARHRHDRELIQGKRLTIIAMS